MKSYFMREVSDSHLHFAEPRPLQTDVKQTHSRTIERTAIKILFPSHPISRRIYEIFVEKPFSTGNNSNNLTFDLYIK